MTRYALDIAEGRDPWCRAGEVPAMGGEDCRAAKPACRLERQEAVARGSGRMCVGLGCSLCPWGRECGWQAGARLMVCRGRSCASVPACCVLAP